MKRYYKVITLTLLTAAWGAGASAQTPAEGINYLDKEQPRKAQQHFNALIAKEPQKAEAYVYQGISYLKTEKLDSANIFFKKAVAVDAKSALAHTGLGYWFLQKGQQAEAAAAFDKALQLSKSKDAEVLQWIAAAKLSQEKPSLEEVHALLDKALKQSESAELHLLKGNAFLAKGEGGPAISSYEKAVALEKANAKALSSIAKVYVRTKNYPLAIDYLQQAIAADPAYTTAYKELGEVFYLQRQPMEAAAHYQKYLALTELKHPARMRAGYMLYLAKDYAGASALFEEVLKQEPENKLILKYQAYSQLEAEQLQAAESTFAHYFSLVAGAERDVLDYERYARLLVKQGNATEAIVQYKVVLEKEPQHAEALQALGELYFKQKSYTLSANAYEQLLRLRKQPLAQDYFAIGKSYYYASSYAQADTAFTKLLELQPELLASSLWKARTLANIDADSEQGLAKPFYEKVAEKGVADEAKYKNELKEAYTYLGYYYYLKADLAASKTYWAKVKAIDPQDEKAINALKALTP